MENLSHQLTIQKLYRPMIERLFQLLQPLPDQTL
eukprot:COSAG03_NODE_97_length_13082_cov_27.816529_11_plen_34_part_00